MTPCSLCLGTEQVCLMDAKLNLYYCAACDHTFTLKRKDEHERYEEEYFFKKHPNWFANPNTKLFGFILRELEKLAAKRPLQLLDVGCGTGDLLKYLDTENRSLELYGIDPLANQHPRIHFIQGDFFIHETGRRFDVVTTLMVIEHIDNPRRFIERLNENLLPGGLLILSTNNNGGLLYALGCFLKAWGVRLTYDRLYSDHHLQHFTNRSLRSILEKNGFEVLFLKNHNYPLRAVDTPPASPVGKKFYLIIVAVIFWISDIFGNGFLQTYVCRKKSASNALSTTRPSVGSSAVPREKARGL